MKKLVNSAQMKKIDMYAIDNIGIPALVLMENAAYAVVSNMEKVISREDIILIVCGSGNNGGDGLAVARILLNRGYQVDVFLAGNPAYLSKETAQQLKIVENLDMVIWNTLDEVNFANYTILVDALFGIGLDRDVDGETTSIIKAMNTHEGIIFAVDMPSGISADDGKIKGVAVRADYTVTFGEEKVGQLLFPGSAYCGTLVVADIGFPPIAADTVDSEFYRYEKSDLARLPRRQAYSNKGTFGRVLIVAGAINMSGAAYLSAHAAYRTGAGLVEILTVDANRTILQTQLPEAVLTTFNPDQLDEAEEKEKIKQAVKRSRVIVMGPGLGVSDESKKLLDYVTLQANVPLIVDADAINVAAHFYNTFPLMRGNACLRLGELNNSLPKGTILTPHLLELARLMDMPVNKIQEDLLNTADICTKDTDLVYVLKDARSVVAHGHERYINSSGNNGMATAGTGDVLTGILAGLVAQGMDSFEAAKLGVYIHGLAGDVAASKKNRYSMMASDVVNGLEDVLGGMV
ncbi:NAD(P)H-hydrate dehydratase [Jeotgalibaca sp. A122]|uniref:NAD(P)H-hydrate dehydratase n=1 Tax=Jeotgalibaca sp. A122 TaxID=3457322 RepID=UPI003FD2A345